jgi:peptide/nickel transport system substrate-binding protein
VIFSYTRAVTLNKSPAFILNVLGWQPDNIASQLKKVDDHTCSCTGPPTSARRWR